MYQQSRRSLRVALLAGGDSPERDVSLRSGAAVSEALSQAGHRVTSIDPAETLLTSLDATAFDVCFIALHGGAGEDGRVQQVLETMGLPYTGSGPQASRLAMSKRESKQRFVECGVPTPNFEVAEEGLANDKFVARCAALGPPWVVKPDRGGSSLGLSVVETPEMLAEAVSAALAFDVAAVIEPFVSGREFTVAFVDDRPLPTIEIVTPEAVFSHHAKYRSTQTEFRTEFGLPAARRGAILIAAIGAVRALDTAGLSRVDVLLDDAGRAWVLEVNTVPGMTERSLAPLAAKAAGLEMAALCDLLLRACLETARVA